MARIFSIIICMEIIKDNKIIIIQDFIKINSKTINNNNKIYNNNSKVQ